jgi:hypothetical protein
MKKISKKWLQMSEFYKRFVPTTTFHLNKENYEIQMKGFDTFSYEEYQLHFCKRKNEYDFSDEAAWEMYQFESTGTPKLYLTSETTNGFLVGKHWMDVTIKMWQEDLDKGLLTMNELYYEYDEWFIKRMLTKS